MTGFLCHQVASTDPEMFCHGPKMAGASAVEGLARTPMARPEAIPPFCMPTSNATARESLSLSLISFEAE